MSAVNVARYQNYTLDKAIPAGTSTSSYFQAKEFTVSSSVTLIRVSVAWLKNNRISGNHITDTPTDGIFANIELRITDPNGETIYTTANIRTNVEIIEFVPKMTGEYTIWLQNISGNTEKIYYGLAWW